MSQLTTPNGLREIIHTFGDSGAANFEASNIVSFDLPYALLYDGKPVLKARCHKLIVNNFIQAFDEISARDLKAQARNYGGIFAKRSIRGYSSHPSCHSWGIAIDLEPAKYPLGSANRFPDEIVEIFERAGFFYGGNFKHRKDPMHFQYAINY